jgi:hypothetical protein
MCVEKSDENILSRFWHEESHHTVNHIRTVRFVTHPIHTHILSRDEVYKETSHFTHSQVI